MDSKPFGTLTVEPASEIGFVVRDGARLVAAFHTPEALGEWMRERGIDHIGRPTAEPTVIPAAVRPDSKAGVRRFMGGGG